MGKLLVVALFRKSVPMFQRVPQKKVVLFFTGATFRSVSECSKLLIIKKKKEEEVILWNRK